MEPAGRTSTEVAIAAITRKPFGNTAHFGKVVFGGTCFVTSPEV